MKRKIKNINKDFSKITFREFQDYLAGIIDSCLRIKITLKQLILIIRFNKQDKNHLEEIQNKLKKFIPKIKIPSKIVSRENNYVDLDIYDLNEMQHIITILSKKLLSKKVGKINLLIKEINKTVNFILNNNIKCNKLKHGKLLSYNSVNNMYLNIGYDKSNIYISRDIEYIKIKIEKTSYNNIEEYILNSNWLRGFISNKGYFVYPKIKLMSFYPKKFSYILVLSSLNNKLDKLNNEKLINLLKKIFVGEISIYKNKYILSISNQIGLNKIINYLNKYPLLNNKNILYNNYKKLYINRPQY